MSSNKPYTTAQTYTVDGVTRQFTIIDHDIKTKISTHHETEEDKKARKDENEKELKEALEEILQFPPIFAALPEDDIVQAYIFNEIINSQKDISWDEPILRETCRIDPAFAFKLRDRLRNNAKNVK